jgi:hypothetical protein
LVRDGTLLVGLLAGIAQVIGRLPPPGDASVYWLAGADPELLYPTRWDVVAGPMYVYPPPLALTVGALHVLPYEVYIVVTTALLFAALWYCAGRWTPVIIVAGIVGTLVRPLWPLAVPLSYALLGNVQLLLAAGIVIALRHPVAWSLPVLTKIGPGVGLVWYVARREWRSLAMALLGCAIVVLISGLAAPGAWGKYLAFVQRSSDLYIPLPVIPIPWLIRLLMSSALIAWGGATGRAWTVPIGAGWAMPALYPWSFLGIWIGAIRLLDGRPPVFEGPRTRGGQPRRVDGPRQSPFGGIDLTA